tara:strand:+ start:2145 stop:2756 length:612 start_codon:yes stop_codon:yes gene_type:complete
MFALAYVYILSVPYYYNPQIHNLGNIGFGGNIHAILSPIARRVIDTISYNGKNIRKDIMLEYSDKKILDLCCGIGDSTGKFGTGVDTSKAMIRMAKIFNRDKEFYIGNAETIVPSEEFDIVSCMFAFHEMPLDAQNRVIKNAIKIAKKEVIIIDIASNYNPKEIMLDGEPYLLNYLCNIDNILSNFDKTIYIDNHVNIWKLKK